MNAGENTSGSSFVVLHIGDRKFAVRSEMVVELAPPVRLHKFPHASHLISGVIVRRGRIVPVYDAASVLVGRSSSAQRFYLIARRKAESATDLGAIPVNGECELASAEMAPPTDTQHASWVCGSISLSDESVDVVDFGALANADTNELRPAEQPS